MFITCQLIDLLLIVEQKLQAIKCALPLGNERSPGVTCDHVKIKGPQANTLAWDVLYPEVKDVKNHLR